MPGSFSQLCLVHRCSFILSDEYRHLTQAHHRALESKVSSSPTAAAAARQRRRRAGRAAATPLHRRRRLLGCHSLYNLKLDERRPDMATQPQVRRRYSVADRTPIHFVADMAATPGVTASAADNNIIDPASTTTPAPAPAPAPVPECDPARIRQNSQPEPSSILSGASSFSKMPPPSSVSRDGAPSFRRHTRAQSSIVYRQVNRLSLTLPIAPPTSDPSRPTPTSASMSSVPQTPIESAAASPADANEFIIAIAAHERRVLELREELSRAESDLTTLKKKWSSFSRENPHKSRESPFPDPARAVTPVADDDASSRRSADLDRKKLLLQQTNTATPPASRRRVMRGGHTRTLSLLSPTKPGAEFPVHEDSDAGEPVTLPLPPIERRTAQLTDAHLSKRASWQPRTQPLPGTGMPQLVEDFKLGLRAFVEDIRQITVGDEPINGQQVASASSSRAPSVDGRSSTSRDSPGNQDTIRANPPLRPKVSTVFEQPNSTTATPTPGSKTEDAIRDKAPTKNAKAKHFSWTPLGFDTLDDNDWSNWESPSTQSPASAKTSRWSGSTMGSSVDGMAEDAGPVVTPSKKRSTPAEAPLLSPAKLDEILPSVVNRLTPSNIRRTATNLMDEWEKSLTEPSSPQTLTQGADKENSA